MKRQIKFRRLHCDSFIYSDEENCCVFWGGLSEKEEESLSQFTGLFDKNGKEIYEGDILQNGVITMTHNVKRYRAEFVKNLNSHAHCFHEIIGNVYENPELINKQNNGDEKYKMTPSYAIGVTSPQMMPWDPRSSNLD